MDIRWNKERQEKRLTEQAQKDLDQKAGKAKALIRHEYEQWARRLQKAVKKGEVTSPQHLVEALHELNGTVTRICADTPGMEEFRQFTLAMIEDKVSQVVLTEAGKKNQIVEYIPPEERNKPDRLTVAESAVFENYDELLDVPFVQKFLAMKGSIGLFTQGCWVKVMWSDKTSSMVGMCINKVGLGKFPTHSELVAELDRFEKERAKKGGKK